MLLSGNFHRDSTLFRWLDKVTHTKLTDKVGKSEMHVECSLHSENEESLTDSNKSSKMCSIPKDQLEGCPLTKQSIFDVYSDIFTRIGKFPGESYKFQLKTKYKTCQTCPQESSYTSTGCLP